MATMEITEPTPMMMPSMVRKALSLLRCKAFRAMRNRLKRDMVYALTGRGPEFQLVILRHRQGGQYVPGRTPVLVRAVFYYFTVLQHDRPAAERGDIGLV